MRDPDSITAIYWLLILAVLMLGVAWLCHRKTRRNRYTGMRAPFDDDRSSIRNFKRMHST